jgi:hypothetical protein
MCLLTVVHATQLLRVMFGLQLFFTTRVRYLAQYGPPLLVRLCLFSAWLLPGAWGSCLPNMNRSDTLAHLPTYFRLARFSGISPDFKDSHFLLQLGGDGRLQVYCVLRTMLAGWLCQRGYLAQLD